MLIALGQVYLLTFLLLLLSLIVSLEFICFFIWLNFLIYSLHELLVKFRLSLEANYFIEFF